MDEKFIIYSLLLALAVSANAATNAQNECSGLLLAKAKTKQSKGGSELKSSETSSNDENASGDDKKPAAAEKKSGAEEKKSSDDEKKSSAAADTKSDESSELAEAEQKGRSFSGNVSWYGIPFHGKKTASGEIFDMYKLSAAHLTLHLPTRCLVEDPRTGNAVIVKVNDRGPYVKTRVMDLSREAARELGTLPRGVAYLDITVLNSKNKAKSKG